MTRPLPEVLAPVGDKERLIAAVQYGADAVYLGGKQFGMRTAPQNFDADELKNAVSYCHGHDVRLYLTCNTLPSNEEIEQLPDFLRYAQEIGVDALIVADLGVMDLAKRYAPEVDLHVSTQAGVVNYAAARQLYEMGARRVVLARELPLEEIRRIRDCTPPDLEIETFVHGAMCVSFSGRCLLSHYLTGRDANRGACAQPCRWSYHLMEEKRPGQFFPVVEEDGGTYILNAQDLCMLEHLDRLAQAGITSFKIEGRAKSAYYVSVITNAYRCAVDLYGRDPAHFELPDWLREEPYKVSHRQYSTGFYFGEPGEYYENGGYVRGWDVVAMVEHCDGRFLHCTQRNLFLPGDEVELLQPGCAPERLIVPSMETEEGEPLERANHPMQALRIPFEKSCPPGSILRKQRT